jgi:hypothetical protein
MLLPAVSKVVTKFASAQVSMDQAAIACALERYRLAEGALPEKLDALVPHFMKSLPRDIINGEPYKYRKNSDGSYLISSVGWDTTDEGGTSSKRIREIAAGRWVWDSAPAGPMANTIQD